MPKGESRTVGALVHLLERPLSLVDVGCRWGVSPLWRALGPYADIVGFDPDEAECTRLTESWDGPGTARFLPLALGASRRNATLHLTSEAATASIFPPVAGIWDAYSDLGGLRPSGTRAIELVPLDDVVSVENIGPVDVIKLDVQGAELEVLRGARKALEGIRCVDLEVTFEPMYEGQATFGDVDAYLRGAGFRLWRLSQLVHHTRRRDPPSTWTANANFHDFTQVPVPLGPGQVFWGQAVYIDTMTLDRDDWRECLRDAAAFWAVDLPDREAAAVNAAAVAAPREVGEVLRDLHRRPSARWVIGTALRKLGLRRARASADAG